MSRIVFHIGAPKSGTTHIQALLWKNKKVLAGEGIFLPGRRQVDQFNIGRDIRQKPPIPDHPHGDWSGAFERAVTAFERSGKETLVFTDERLAAAGPEAIQQAVERVGGRAEVIYGMRDFAGVLTSSWQERVKDVVDKPFATWLRGIRKHNEHEYFWQMHDAPAVLERWSLGWTLPVSVLALPAPGSPDDELWRRFQQIIGWQVPTDTAVDRVNESIGFVEADLLRRVQAKMPEKGHHPRRHHIMKQHVAAQVLGQRTDTIPILIPEGFREWVMEEGARRRELLDRPNVTLVGDQAELVETDRRFGEVSIEGNEAAMLDAAVEVIASLVDRVAASEERRARRRNDVTGPSSSSSSASSTVARAARKFRGGLTRFSPGRG